MRFPRKNKAEKEKGEIDKKKGSLKKTEEEKLMHSVMEDDGQKKKGKALNEAVNKGVSFSPDVIFDKLTKDYRSAKELLGETIIQELSGFDESFVKRNAKIPEFQRELKNNIFQKIEELRKQKLIDKEGNITEKGFKLASLTLCMQELDKITPKDMFGEKISDKKSIYGEKEDVDSYNKNYRYRDIAMKRTIKTALRRGHKEVAPEDLKIFTRKNKGNIYLIYAMDSSGSMKGKKMEVAKKAGIGLAHKAISSHDKVGLVVFSSNVEEYLMPTDDFFRVIDKMTRIKAGKETNMVFAIDKAIEMFPPGDVTKHLIMITDAVPTVGDKEDILEAVMKARSHNITISVIGINLIDGRNMAQQITEYGNGKLYILKNLENMDQIVLQDYYSL
ncbi:MAG: vWA domain-containing protein [Candidatus Woesearchaeota archaeon]